MKRMSTLHGRELAFKLTESLARSKRQTTVTKPQLESLRAARKKYKMRHVRHKMCHVDLTAVQDPEKEPEVTLTLTLTVTPMLTLTHYSR